jgi:hypothetical protein
MTRSTFARSIGATVLGSLLLAGCRNKSSVVVAVVALGGDQQPWPGSQPPGHRRPALSVTASTTTLTAPRCSTTRGMSVTFGDRQATTTWSMSARVLQRQYVRGSLPANQPRSRGGPEFQHHDARGRVHDIVACYSGVSGDTTLPTARARS